MSQNFRILFSALLFLLTFSAFTSCSRFDIKNQSVNQKKIPDSDSEEISEIVLSEPSENKKTYAIVYPLLHPFFAETNRGAKEAAEKTGVNLILLGPLKYSVPDQIAMMESLIEMNVDGIGLGAFDPLALNPVINRAVDAGINVICFDTDAPDSRRLSFISTDNYAQGMHLGEITAEYLGNKGKIIISQGVPTQLNLNQRLEGVKAYLANFPEIQIAGIETGYGDDAQTIASIEKMVNEHPDFEALIGLDAQAGPSAAVVWRSRGLNQFLIVSEDMPETIKGIRDNIVTATITQEQYLWGKLIIERLDQAEHGIKLIPRETTSTRLITIDNVSQYYSEDYDY